MFWVTRSAIIGCREKQVFAKIRSNILQNFTAAIKSAFSHSLHFTDFLFNINAASTTKGPIYNSTNAWLDRDRVVAYVVSQSRSLRPPSPDHFCLRSLRPPVPSGTGPLGRLADRVGDAAAASKAAHLVGDGQRRRIVEKLNGARVVDVLERPGALLQSKLILKHDSLISFSLCNFSNN